MLVISWLAFVIYRLLIVPIVELKHFRQYQFRCHIDLLIVPIVELKLLKKPDISGLNALLIVPIVELKRW